MNQAESPITVDFKATAPGTVANSITLTCEASVSTNGLVRKLLAFNYDTSTWVEVDSRSATLADQVVTATISSSVSSYIDPITREMKMRLLVRPGGPVGSSSWTGSVDLVSWTVSQ